MQVRNTYTALYLIKLLFFRSHCLDIVDEYLKKVFKIKSNKKEVKENK